MRGSKSKARAAWNALVGPPDLSALVKVLEKDRDKANAVVSAEFYDGERIAVFYSIYRALDWATFQTRAFAAGKPPFGKENENGQ